MHRGGIIKQFSDLSFRRASSVSFFTRNTVRFNFVRGACLLITRPAGTFASSRAHPVGIWRPSTIFIRFCRSFCGVQMRVIRARPSRRSNNNAARGRQAIFKFISENTPVAYTRNHRRWRSIDCVSVYENSSNRTPPPPPPKFPTTPYGLVSERRTTVVVACTFRINIYARVVYTP